MKHPTRRVVFCGRLPFRFLRLLSSHSSWKRQIRERLTIPAWVVATQSFTDLPFGVSPWCLSSHCVFCGTGGVLWADIALVPPDGLGVLVAGHFRPARAIRSGGASPLSGAVPSSRKLDPQGARLPPIPSGFALGTPHLSSFWCPAWRGLALDLQRLARPLSTGSDGGEDIHDVLRSGE